MAYEGIVDPTAHERFDEVVDYNSTVLGSPLVALGILDDFDEVIEKLEQR